ncbi:MAG: YegS/Rv2252/BmrU family lipid kinase [Clostridia bacterium]|nr:YegS/Rv2252/BmrU family lipid kinase [Clostridia bacterium]
MIYHFILNPKSGRSPQQKRMEQDIVDACLKRQLSYHIYYTTRRKNAITYVRSMIKEYPDERQRFICVGGDGTINEIANSAPANPNIEFGVIPNGSGNDFVRNFKHRRKFTEIDAQIDGEVKSFDLIKCNDDYCVNMVNIGFDCSVVIEADKFRKYKFISPGISYVLGVVVGFFFKKFGTQMRIIFDDGEIIDKQLTLTAIGNGKFCGGGFKSAPKACLADGLLDVCIIDKVSRLSFLQLVGCYKDGTFLEKKKAQKIVKYKQTNHFKMEFDAPQPICIDGEVSNAKTVEFTVIPGAFNFVIPKGSSLRFPDEYIQ